MFDILTIDGTGGDATSDALADLLYDPRYALESYVPGVASRRASQLGGSGPYTDVADALTVHVVGATPALAYAAIEVLAGRIDQAEQWRRGLPVSPVLIRAHDQQSTEAQPAAAAILGWSGERPVAWPWPKQQPDGTYVIQNVQLRFQRAGLWTLPPRCINYVANWSFESDNSTTPGGWSTTAVAPGVTVASIPSVTAQHGINVRSVQNTNAGGTAMLYQDVSGLTPGASYRVSIYAYRSAGAGNVGLTAYDGGGVTNAVSATTTAAAFTRLEVTKVCPAGGSIRVALTAAGSTTGVFDAAILEVLPASGSASPVASVDGARSNRLASANVLFATFGEDVALPCPVRAELTRTDASGTEQQGTFYPCLWALTNSWAPNNASTKPPPHINVTDAAPFAGGGVSQYTSVAASATLSHSGSILRYTPTTTAEVKMALANTTDNLVLSGAPVAFLTVQASVDNQFTVRGYIGSVVGATDLAPNAIVSAPVTVRGTAKQVIALRWPEVVANITNTNGVKFRLSVESTAASGTLDIDVILFVATDQHPQVVQAYTATGAGRLQVAETVLLSYLDTGLNAASGLMSSANYRLAVDPRAATYADGVVGITREDAAWDAGLSYLGTPDLYLSGYQVASVWLAPDATNWRYAVSGPAAMQNQLIVTRRKSALVPS